MNRLHSCNITNEERDVPLNLRQRPVNTVGLSMGVLDLDSQAKGTWLDLYIGPLNFPELQDCVSVIALL